MSYYGNNLQLSDFLKPYTVNLETFSIIFPQQHATATVSCHLKLTSYGAHDLMVDEYSKNKFVHNRAQIIIDPK